MTERDPIRIKEVLAEGGLRAGLDHALEAGRVWAAWDEIVGPAIARHAEPTSLRDGILRIRADSPVWATEVGYLAPDIERRSNEVAGASVVDEVRVWHKPGPVTERGSTRGPARVTSPPPNDGGKEQPSSPIEAYERARAAWEKARLSRRRRRS